MDEAEALSCEVRDPSLLSTPALASPGPCRVYRVTPDGRHQSRRGRSRRSHALSPEGGPRRRQKPDICALADQLDLLVVSQRPEGSCKLRSREWDVESRPKVKGSHIRRHSPEVHCCIVAPARQRSMTEIIIDILAKVFAEARLLYRRRLLLNPEIRSHLRTGTGHRRRHQANISGSDWPWNNEAKPRVASVAIDSLGALCLCGSRPQ